MFIDCTCIYSLPTACQKIEPLPYKLSLKTSTDRMARQDSRHRSPEKGRDAECTYSFEIGTIKIDRSYYQKAWWTFAKENPLWRTTSWKTLPWRSEEAIQGHPQSLPYRLQHTKWVVGTDRTKWRGLIRRGAGEYGAKRISEAV